MRLLILSTVVATVAGLAIVGCQSSKTAATKPVHYYYQDADATAAAKNGQALEDPSKVASKQGASKAELAKLTKVQQAAKAAMDKNPSAETKAKFVKLTVDLADETMYSNDLTPHEKYPAALRLYRAALKVDPTNVVAKDSADTIVDIYTNSLHRPVPE